MSLKITNPPFLRTSDEVQPLHICPEWPSTRVWPAPFVTAPLLKMVACIYINCIPLCFGERYFSYNPCVGRLTSLYRPYCTTSGTRLTNIGGDSLVWVCRVNTGHGAVNSAQVYYRKGGSRITVLQDG